MSQERSKAVVSIIYPCELVHAKQLLRIFLLAQERKKKERHKIEATKKNKLNPLLASLVVEKAITCTGVMISLPGRIY